jgi:hypothetical protein
VTFGAPSRRRADVPTDVNFLRDFMPEKFSSGKRKINGTSAGCQWIRGTKKNGKFAAEMQYLCDFIFRICLRRLSVDKV